MPVDDNYPQINTIILYTPLQTSVTAQTISTNLIEGKTLYITQLTEVLSQIFHETAPLLHNMDKPGKCGSSRPLGEKRGK